ncbi:hypothetical protein L6452_26788 [Arctium lappa]|uniref:Uncharacterized protein n=1 Tax=Arctium lappa TaxID=4217 RepID=A0ACB8ZWN4_ARCLA|nr:hypothetical protein L6452_26788 [Arctium lappa]
MLQNGMKPGGLHVKSSMAEFSKSDRADEVESVKLSELLYDRHFRVVFIGSALLALQQLSGINVVFNFYSTVFKSGGVPSDILNMSVGAFSMAMQAVAGSTLVSGSSEVYLSVVAGRFVLSFPMGVGPVPGLLLSEIFPSRIRAKAMAICMAVHWVTKFLCWFAISAVAGTTWGPESVHSLRKFFLVGIFLCQEQCAGGGDLDPLHIPSSIFIFAYLNI